jgi:hypothetical protein
MRHLSLLMLFSCFTVTASFGPAAAVAAEEGKPSTVSVFGKATMKVPPQFERTEPRISMIQDEFIAKAGEGEDAPTARLYMMNSGGSVKTNLDRWRGQFAQQDSDAFKTEEKQAGEWKVVIAEHEGTYLEKMGGGPFAPGRTVERPDYGMLGAIVLPPEAAKSDSDFQPKYFVKMIGPTSVIEANRKAFREMVDSLEAE